MKNVGLIDRIIRIILVAAIFYVYYMGWITGLVTLGAAFVAVLLLVTAFTSDCPLYNWIGINTHKKVKTS